MAEATTGAANINGTPLAPNGSTAAPARAGVGVDGRGVHMQGTPMITDMARMVEEDFIEDDVDRVIVKQMQSGFPIDQICRYIPSAQKASMRYEYYSIDERPIKTTIATKFTTGTAGEVTIKVSDSSLFGPTDTILVKKVKASAAGTTDKDRAPLRLYVVGLGSNTGELKVVALNGPVDNTNKRTVPTLEVGTEVYKIAPAASEGDVQTNIFESLPTKKERYMQIFKTQVSESSIMAASNKEVDFTIDDQSEIALRNLRKSIETAYIFGVQSYTYVPSLRKWVYTCGGILEQMLEGGHMIAYTPNALANGGEKYLLNDLIKPIFLGNSGTPRRYAFMGSDIVSNIATLPGIQKQMDAKQVERKYGVDWKTIQFMTWSVSMYQHPLLDEFGMSNCAIVLDLAYVQKCVFRSLSQDALKLKEAGVFDGQSMVWTEISSINLKYPETHALIFDIDEYDPGLEEESSSSSSSAS